MFSIIWITSHHICEQITYETRQNSSDFSISKMHSELNFPYFRWWRNCRIAGLGRNLSVTPIHFLPFRSTYLTRPRQEKLILSKVLWRRWFHVPTQQSILTGTSLSCDLNTSSLSWRIISARKLLLKYNLSPCVYLFLSFVKSRPRVALSCPLCEVVLSSPAAGHWHWLAGFPPHRLFVGRYPGLTVCTPLNPGF